MAKKRKPLPKHWYRQYLGSCPVCMRDHSYRERVYGEKPTDPDKIYIFLSDFETFDNCIY